MKPYASAERSLGFDSLGPLFVVFLSQSVAPVLQGLPHHRGDSEVVISATRPHNFSDEIVLLATFHPGAFCPSAHLALIVLCATTRIKPLERQDVHFNRMQMVRAVF